MASEYTTNFNLDLYSDSDKPNLRDQYNSAIRKLDAQLMVNSNNTTVALNAANDAQKAVDSYKEKVDNNTSDIAKNASDITTANTKIAKNATDISTANANIAKNATDISTANTKIAKNATDISNLNTKVSNNEQTMNDILPITSDKIAAGAITRDKMDAQTLASLMKGTTIRHFWNGHNDADNEGMVVPAEVTFEGFYLPELTMLVISHLEVPAGTVTGDIFKGEGFTLPSYIPHISASTAFIGVGIMWKSGSSFENWTECHIKNNGKIGFTNPNTDFSKTLSAAGVIFLRGYGVD